MGWHFLATNRFYSRRKTIDIEQIERKMENFKPKFEIRKNFTNFLEQIYLDVLDTRKDDKKQ
jgi:hypothetical protein